MFLDCICNIRILKDFCVSMCREAVLFPAAGPPGSWLKVGGSWPASPPESHSGMEPGGDFHTARAVFSSFPVRV